MARGSAGRLGYLWPAKGAGGIALADESGVFREWFFGSESAPVGGLAKIHDGTTWAEKPAKVWAGSSWVQKPVKHWNGSAWVLA